MDLANGFVSQAYLSRDIEQKPQRISAPLQTLFSSCEICSFPSHADAGAGSRGMARPSNKDPFIVEISEEPFVNRDDTCRLWFAPLLINRRPRRRRLTI